MMIPNRLIIDISAYNEVLNIAAVKQAGIVGIIHKSSEGRTFTDRRYDAVRLAAKAAGLLWGAYHFGNDGDVKQQVDNFFATAQPDDQTLMALDFEPNGNHTMGIDQALAFMQLAEARLGRELVVYSGNLMKQVLHGVNHYWGSRRLWLAHYSSSPTCQPSWVKPWLWQYTDGEYGPDPKGVPGIGGAVDCDSYDGTPEQLAKEWPGDKI